MFINSTEKQNRIVENLSKSLQQDKSEEAQLFIQKK